MIETWLWEKEQSHRLFNFHEGYRILEDYNNGSKSTNVEIIGSHVIKKNGPNDIQFLKASEFKNDQNFDKLINIAYNEGKYILFEPKNDNEVEDNIIDNHLWLIMKFMPKKCHNINIDDVIRFGRIPFKVTKLILDLEEQYENEAKHRENVQMVSSRVDIDAEREQSQQRAQESYEGGNEQRLNRSPIPE